MEFEDFMEPEIAVTAAVAAAIFSPRARKVIRKGLVYSMAGVLAAGDAITSLAQSVSHGIQQTGQVAAHEAQEVVNQAREMEKEAKVSGEPKTTTAPRRKTAAKTKTTKST